MTPDEPFVSVLHSRRVAGPREEADGRVRSIKGDVHIRDVEDGDVDVFIEHQLDPETTRMNTLWVVRPPSCSRSPKALLQCCTGGDD
jgi:hypothetical protein